MSEEEGWVLEEQIHSLEAEFWALKEKAREAETWKKSLMYVKRAIGAGLSLTDFKEDSGYREQVAVRMNKLDADMSDATNWIDKGWRFEHWEEADAENRLDNFHVVLADVQAFLVSEGRIQDVEETLQGILESELLYKVKRDLMEAEDGGGEG